MHGVRCDVTCKKERLEMLDMVNRMYGRVDVLILNHAVISHIGRQMEITEAKFDEMINVNLKSCFFMIQESLALLKAAKKPNVLLTSSMSAVDPFY